MMNTVLVVLAGLFYSCTLSFGFRMLSGCANTRKVIKDRWNWAHQEKIELWPPKPFTTQNSTHVITSDTDSLLFASVSKDDLMRIRKLKYDGNPIDSKDNRTIDSVDKIQTAEYFDSSGNLSLRVWVSEAMFPSFVCDKQIEAREYCSNLVFQRCSGVYSNLLPTVESAIYEGNYVALVGPPGTGKSTFINLLLVSLLRRMRVGIDIHVYFYVDKELFLFTALNGRIQVKHCDEVTSVAGIKNARKRHSVGVKSVLLFESFEHEQFDYEELKRPVFVSLSNQDVEESLKGVAKAFKFNQFFYESCTWDEVFTMGVAEADYVGDDRLDQCAWTRDSNGNLLSRDECLHQLVTSRVDCGPIPRYCFASSENYGRHRQTMAAGCSAGLAAAPELSSVLSFPTWSTHYFGISGVSPEFGYGQAKLTLLSEYVCALLGKHISLPKFVAFLRDHGLLESLREVLSRHGLALRLANEKLDQFYNFADWRAYVDTGASPLIEEYQYDMDLLLKNIRICAGECLYTGTRFRLSAEEMKEKVVYHSKLSEHELADFLFRVGHTVYMVQVSRSMPQDYSCRIEDIDTAMKLLKLDEPISPFNVVYAYVTDAGEVSQFYKGVSMSCNMYDNDAQSTNSDQNIKSNSLVSVTQKKNTTIMTLGLLSWRHVVRTKAKLRPPGKYDWIVDKLHTIVVRGTFMPLTQQYPVLGKSDFMKTAKHPQKLLRSLGGKPSDDNIPTIMNRIERKLLALDKATRNKIKYLQMQEIPMLEE